jgi:hypothetical protein
VRAKRLADARLPNPTSGPLPAGAMPKAKQDPGDVGAMFDELEAMVGEGLLEARRRPDGRVGFWPTPRGLAALRKPPGADSRATTH